MANAKQNEPMQKNKKSLSIQQKMDALLIQLQKGEIPMDEYTKKIKDLSNQQTLLLTGLINDDDNNNNNNNNRARDMNELLDMTDDENENENQNESQFEFDEDIEMDMNQNQ